MNVSFSLIVFCVARPKPISVPPLDQATRRLSPLDFTYPFLFFSAHRPFKVYFPSSQWYAPSPRVLLLRCRLFVMAKLGQSGPILFL